MMRTGLFGVTLLVAVAACHGDARQGPAVVAGAPAGDVIDVVGTVHATRSGRTRLLTVGAEVSGDDVIDTAADGSVTIELRHNHVAWSLSAGRKQEVGLTTAWRAKAASGASAAEIADRRAEREAATIALAEKDAEIARLQAELAALQGTLPDAGVDPRHPPTSKKLDGGTGAAGPTPLLAPGVGTGAPPTGPGSDDPAAVDAGSETLVDSVDAGADTVADVVDAAAAGSGAPTRSAVTIGTLTVTGPLSSDVEPVLRTHLAQYTTCGDRARLREPSTMTIELTIGDDGKVRALAATDGPTVVVGCVMAAMHDLQFPSAETATRATVPMVYQPASGF